MSIVLVALIVIAIVIGIALVVMVMRLAPAAKSSHELIKDRVVLKIAVPRHNEKSPVAAEQMFSSLHGMVGGKQKSMDHFSLEIAAGSYGVHFIVVVDRKYKAFIENQFYGQYPEAQISEIGDYTDSFGPNAVYTFNEVGLAKESFLPIKTFESFDVDPLAAITSAMSSLDVNNEAFIQIVCRPIADYWTETGKKFVNEQKNKKDANGNRVPLESGETEVLSRIERKNTKVGFQFRLRVVVKSNNTIDAERISNEIVASLGQYKTGQFNSLGNRSSAKLTFWQNLRKQINNNIRSTFYPPDEASKLSQLDKFRFRFLADDCSDIANIEELASLYHLPSKSVETPNISWADSKKLEFPLNIPTENSRIIGVTDYRGVHVPFGIKPTDRLRHMYLIGKTGMGKSTFVENMIMADIYEGEGLAFIDPHGDSINMILDHIPEHRKKDVVIFDPGDAEYPPGLNLLAIKPGENKSLIADGLVSVFKKAFSDSWGPRLEYILTNAMVTLLNCKDVNMLAIPRILSDKNYRKSLLKQIDDPVLLKFWQEEYSQMSKTSKDMMDNIGSILNKIGRFTTNPLIRNIVGQMDSSLDFDDVMNNRKILLINLAQGKIGEENMALLGGMLITRIYSNIVKRVELEKKDRVPFYLYVDEFQNFATSTFIKILSEARKFGLGLIFTHQFIDQISPEIQSAIFGNVGSMMNFAVGPSDANRLVREYSPYLTEEDIVNLGKFCMIIKLSIDFAQSKPFTARTLPPNYPLMGQRQEIVDLVRAQYSKARANVEEEIYAWSAQIYNDHGEIYVPKAMREDGTFEPGNEPPSPQFAERPKYEPRNNDKPRFNNQDRPPRKDFPPRRNDSNNDRRPNSTGPRPNQGNDRPREQRQSGPKSDNQPAEPVAVS